MIGIRIRGFHALPAMLLPCLLLAQQPLVLHDGTPVRLRLNRNLSSADATVGESADFEVLEDVIIGDMLVIARGGTAIATVTAAQSKRRMARGGKIDINIDYVRLVNDDKVALRAVKEAKGGGHTAAMTGAIVASALIFFPAAPFFLFMQGKDITVPKGTAITAYVQGDIVLDPAKLIPKSGAVQSPVSPAAPLPGALPPTPVSEPPPPGPLAQTAPTSTPRPSSQAIPDDFQESAGRPAAPAHPSAKPMTNQDVIALKTAGFSDEFIIAKIKGTPASYRIDTDDIITVKKANLSEAVIQAMTAAVSSSAGPPLLPPAAAAGSVPNTKTPTPSDAPHPAAAQAATARPTQQPDQSTLGAGEAPSKGLLTKLKGAFSSPSDEHKRSTPQTAPAEHTVPPQFALTSVTVLSRPAGAAIFVDNYPAGRTPAVVKLVPGKYKLTLKAEGFPDYSQQITVEPGQVSSFGVALDGSK
jgi:hypothetical protein